MMVNETVSVLGGSGFMDGKPSQGYYYLHINENTLSNLYILKLFTRIN